MSKHEHIKQFEIETETDAVKVLRRAREMIYKEGWCQDLASIVKFGRHDRCASQAILDAVFETTHSAILDAVFKTAHSRYNPAYLIDEANRLFIVAIGSLNNNIPDWNDNKHRTKEDVLAAFDKATRIASS